MRTPNLLSSNTEAQKYTALHVLVEKAVQGDTEARRELLVQIADKVLFKMKYLVGDHENAEDATQDVLLYVWEHIGDLRNPKVFNAWLGKIIINRKNKFFTQNATQKMHLHLDDYAEQILEDNVAFLPYECAENSELRKIVMSAVESLSLRQRESVILHYYEGLSVSETSAVMGVSQPYVSNCLKSARKNIEDTLMSHPSISEYIGVSGAVPVGIFLAQVLENESTNIFIDDMLLQSILSKAGELSISSAPYAGDIARTSVARGSLSSIFSLKLVTRIATAVLMVALMIIGIVGYIQLQQSEIYVPEQVSIAFSGGTEIDEGTIWINPVQAEISSNATAVRNWQISAQDGTLIYEGEGNTANYGLQMLRESNLSGEFVLNMWLESDSDADLLHRTSRNFYIVG